MGRGLRLILLMPHTLINAHQLGRQISLAAQQATSMPPIVAYQLPMNPAPSRKVGKLQFMPQQQSSTGPHPTCHPRASRRGTSLCITPLGPYSTCRRANEQRHAGSHGIARACADQLAVHVGARSAAVLVPPPGAVLPIRSCPRRAHPRVSLQTCWGRTSSRRSRSSLRQQLRRSV